MPRKQVPYQVISFQRQETTVLRLLECLQTVWTGNRSAHPAVPEQSHGFHCETSGHLDLQDV